ncbi:MAG: DUF4268 domain-containing protein [Ferruginibacter sp.]
MYSRQEISRLNQEFWTSLGMYMSPIPSAEGQKINWVNYKTEVKYTRLKMWAEDNKVSLGLYFSHPDEDASKRWRQLFESLLDVYFYDELPHFKLQEVAGIIPVSFHYMAEIDNLSIMRKEDWPAMISFLKPRLIHLDAAWINNKELFEMLV